MNHDKLSTRLTQILFKLNSGESLSLVELANEFNVSLRTIQRDINERFSYLPLIRENGYIKIEEYALGKLSFKDIKNFATLSGIRNLYPTLDDDFIVDLINTRLNSTYLIKGYEYENLEDKKDEFNLINLSIVTHKQLNLIYNNKPRVINPYKLVNTKGTWYLVGSEDDTLKTYTFSKILNLKPTNNSFISNDKFIDTIDQNAATWFSQTIIYVELQINISKLDYFKKKSLLPNQKIISVEQEHFIVTTQVSYDEEILSVVKYWIPHIKILKPTYLKDILRKQLNNYEI